jgi:hypothetical protein
MCQKNEARIMLTRSCRHAEIYTIHQNIVAYKNTSKSVTDEAYFP